jgi:hypothetical protein
MTKKELEPFLPKWRIGALSLKEFHLLQKEEKNNYIKELMLIPDKDRGDVDKHILRYDSISIKPDNKNFFTLEDI